jgi:hypothetical protein
MGWNGIDIFTYGDLLSDGGGHANEQEKGGLFNK